MRKKATIYSKETKLSLLREYHESGMSKQGFAKLHGLNSSTLINAWIKAYESGEEELSLPSHQTEEAMAKRSEAELRDEIARLRKELKEKEKALAISRLETEARDMLIDTAEKYFKIPIRKKSGVK